MPWPIVGPRTEEHWHDNLGALDYEFTNEDEAFVDQLVVPGHASTPGYNDPQYPVEERILGCRSRIETSTHICTLGCARPLEDAMRIDWWSCANPV